MRYEISTRSFKEYLKRIFMKVYAISDFHLCNSGEKPMEIFGGDWTDYQEKIKQDWKDKVKEEDVVVICGDISWAMKLETAKNDLKYFDDLKGYKIFIRGNHDYWWQSISAVRNSLPNNSFALQNDAIKIGKYIFCGTRGWTVPEKQFATSEDKKIYNRELIRLKMALESAKHLKTNGEIIICMLHYPPYNSNKENNEIIKLLQEYNVDFCIFGHIHACLGKYKLYEKLFGINFYLTSCDLLKNKLVEITK